MTFDHDTIHFESTGRDVPGCMGVVGLDAAATTPHYGYDGFLSEQIPSRAPLTPPERRELAVHMIQLWTTWASRRDA